jgi:hypothetical protein
MEPTIVEQHGLRIAVEGCVGAHFLCIFALAFSAGFDEWLA